MSDITSFDKELKRLSKIDVDRKIPFNLDKVVPPQEEPEEHDVDLDWFRIRRAAKEEFEVDGAAHVFSTYKIEINGDIFGLQDYDFRDDFVDLDFWRSLELRGGKYILNSMMDDKRASQLIQSLPEDSRYLLRIKFLRQNENGWFVEDKYDPIGLEKKKGNKCVEISTQTKPGVPTGIDKVYYNIAYPVAAVIYGLYKIDDPDVNKLPPMKDGGINCVAHRVIEHFEMATGSARVRSIHR